MMIHFLSFPIADCFQLVNDGARQGFLLLTSTEDIPHWQQEHIDRIVYFLPFIALGTR